MVSPIKLMHLLSEKVKVESRESIPTTYISKEETDKLMDSLGYSFDPEEFFNGVNVEFEHKDITNGDPVMTAKIAAAHLRENPKYYTLLKTYVENPSVHENGLVAADGTINGAPSEKTVKKTRKMLDREK